MVDEFGTLIAHLGDVVGDQTYESLARKGETMTTAEMTTYTHTTKPSRPEQRLETDYQPIIRLPR